jgi:hypothetical protein
MGQSCSLVGITASTTIGNDTFFLFHCILLLEISGLHKKTRKSHTWLFRVPFTIGTPSRFLQQVFWLSDHVKVYSLPLEANLKSG